MWFLVLRRGFVAGNCWGGTNVSNCWCKTV